MEYIFDNPIHPIAVHFVIALSFFAASLDTWAFLKNEAAIAEFAKLTTYFAAIAAFIAIATGLFDHEIWHTSSQHRHNDSSVLGLHMKLGISLALMFCGLAVLRYRIKGYASKLYLLLVLTGVFGIACQAYLGGQLVYLEGINVQTAEDQRAAEVLQNKLNHEHSYDAEKHDH